jgi:hypothetical protein
MYIGSDFDPIEPDEDDTFSLDFTDALTNGTVITGTPEVTLTVLPPPAGVTADATPALRLVGAPSVTTRTNPLTGLLQTFVTQAVGNGPVNQNTYVIEMTVTTSDGRTLSRWSRIPCLAAPLVG